ncbi:DUF3237 domain-containing protein [Ramlibacter sp. MAHUQ-53]|uniref:DUF3237 domain-containing protein n=1 Tax=unclassified Ramlibacter TaxID=2617605 RepID=UPI0036369CCF
MTSPLPTPELRFFADLRVQVDKPQEVGHSVRGLRRVIPILGGTVTTADWSGRILPGGADFQLILNDRTAELDARYVIETDGGDRIYVYNQAVRTAAPEVMARLVRGEPVDPASVYFRCMPRFEASAPSLAWLSENLFLGTGARLPDRVDLRVFHVA